MHKALSHYLVWLFLMAFSAHADTDLESLTFDPSLGQYASDLFLTPDKNQKAIRADKNDFKLLHFAAMSNKRGDRWALVKLKNTSSGRRFLRKQHLVATFADGKRAFAQDLDLSVDGHQTVAKTIFFANSKFPIVHVSNQPE